MQLFSLREHLLTVEKQRDTKAADAAAWAARVQEVQDECNNQMSYQQIEIQVCEHFVALDLVLTLRLQALHQRSHDLVQELQVRGSGCCCCCCNCADM
jgi:hypothetical protein